MLALACEGLGTRYLDHHQIVDLMVAFTNSEIRVDEQAQTAQSWELQNLREDARRVADRERNGYPTG